MLGRDVVAEYPIEGSYREALLEALEGLAASEPGLYLAKGHGVVTPPGPSSTETYRFEGDRKGALERALGGLGDAFYVSAPATVEGQGRRVELSPPKPVFGRGGGGHVPPVDHWEYTTASDAARKVSALEEVSYVSHVGRVRDGSSVLGYVLGRPEERPGSVVLRSREREGRYAVVEQGWGSYRVTTTDGPRARELERPKPVFGRGGGGYFPPIERWDTTSVGEVLDAVKGLDEVEAVYSEERFFDGRVGGSRLEPTDTLTFRGAGHDYVVERTRTFPLFGREVVRVRRVERES